MANQWSLHRRTIAGAFYSFLLPFFAFIAVASILAGSAGVRPFWYLVPEFLGRVGTILLFLMTQGYVPDSFPVLFLSGLAGGYLAGRLNHGDRKYLPHTVFLLGTAAILGTLDHREFTWDWPIAATLNIFPFSLGKLRGDKRRIQEWNPDWLHVPLVLPFYLLIFAGLIVIANSLLLDRPSVVVNFIIRMAEGGSDLYSSAWKIP